MDSDAAGRYIRRVDAMLVAGIAAVALIALVLLAFGRMAWPILTGRETMEAGGSHGRQAFGRRK